MGNLCAVAALSETPFRLPGFRGVPWPRCCPWLLSLAGVALGCVFGFSPWLFLLIGAICLLSGMVGKA